MLVLEGLVVLHRTIQLQLLQHYWSGHRLGRITVILNGLPCKRTEIRLPTSIGSSKKQESSKNKQTNKKTTALLTMPKPLTVCITTNCGKFFNRWEYQTTLPASWEICMQVKKQRLEPNMEQWTGSKLGKEYVKAVYCYTAYLTYMQTRLIQGIRSGDGVGDLFIYKHLSKI